MNLFNRGTLSLFLAATAVSSTFGAEVSGRVELVRKGKPVSAEDTMVVLIPENASAEPSQQPAHHVIETRDKTFTPQYLVVRSGDTVAFPNYDTIRHNVFSSTQEHIFDLGSYAEGESPEHVFRGEGLVKVYCNVHQDMASFVMVIPDGWSTVTGGDGNFRFEGIPAGRYRLKAWNLRGETSALLDIAGEENVEQVLEIDATPYRPEPHKNKFGKDYPRFATDDEIY